MPNDARFEDREGVAEAGQSRNINHAESGPARQFGLAKTGEIRDAAVCEQ